MTPAEDTTARAAAASRGGAAEDYSAYATYDAPAETVEGENPASQEQRARVGDEVHLMCARYGLDAAGAEALLRRLRGHRRDPRRSVEARAWCSRWLAAPASR